MNVVKYICKSILNVDILFNLINNFLYINLKYNKYDH